MGGANSKSYIKFKEHCCEAYIILRKSSNLILNLISMALHAGVVKLDAEKSILKVGIVVGGGGGGCDCGCGGGGSDVVGDSIGSVD